MNRSRTTCAAYASAALFLLGGCGGAASEDAAPPAAPATAQLSVKDAWARAADSGAMTAVYFTLENAGTVADTLRAAESGAAEEIGLHMSMQQGSTMHMAAVGSLPVPPGDSVLFRPLGAHVMLTRTTRALAVGDTVALTLRFVSGQSLEVRADVRQP